MSKFKVTRTLMNGDVEEREFFSFEAAVEEAEKWAYQLADAKKYTVAESCGREEQLGEPHYTFDVRSGPNFIEASFVVSGPYNGMIEGLRSYAIKIHKEKHCGRDYRNEFRNYVINNGLSWELALKMLRMNDGLSNDDVFKILCKNADLEVIQKLYLDLVLERHVDGGGHEP